MLFVHFVSVNYVGISFLKEGVCQSYTINVENCFNKELVCS